MPTPVSETGKLVLDGITLVGLPAIAALTALLSHPDATPEVKAAARAGLDAEQAGYDAEIAAAKARLDGAAESDVSGGTPG